MRRALVSFLDLRARRPVILGVDKKGRPASWCEEVLGDIVAHRNIDVLDDEQRRRARWVDSPAALIDGDYQLLRVDGSEVPNGYVHLLWRGKTPLMLQMPAACTEWRDKAVQCHPNRYTGIGIMDADTPVACSFSYVDVSAWGTWKASMSEIRNPVR